MTAEITEEPVQPVQEAEVQPDEAPYGYMTDPETGQRRPKKRPGRRSKAVKPPMGTSPPLEQLQALGTLPETSEDTAPGAPPKGKRRPAMKAETLPPFRAGVIAKGINKLYRKAGRIIRLFDHDIGTAVIVSATKQADDEDDEDTTVGEAWEALAKSNPRIRAFLLKLIAGGARSALFTAHLPIFMAIIMKDGIRERIPLLQLAQTLLTDDPEEAGGPAVPSDLSQMMGGINPDDLGQMLAMAQGLMGQVAVNVPRPANGPRDPAAGRLDVPATFYGPAGGMEHPADHG